MTTELQIYDLLQIPDERQLGAFRTYERLVQEINALDTVKNVLELGSGYSTFLLSRLAEQRGFTVHSVDVSFDTFDRCAQLASGTKFEAGPVNKLRGTSITKAEFKALYDQGTWPSYAGRTIKELKPFMSEFIRIDIDRRKFDELQTTLNFGETTADLLDHITKSNELRLTPELTAPFSADRLFDNEITFFDRSDLGAKGVVDKELGQNLLFDAIFFDSGEFSGCVEFLKFKDRVRTGGLAAFHDIYLPKSFKNFLVCAVVKADPAWKVIYQDESTAQGMLIAIKVV